MIGPADDEPIAVQLVEEHATLAKRTVTTGRVTVRTKTEVSHENLREQLTGHVVEVRRVPIDRVVETLPPIRTEGDVTILPVLEERLIVTKQLVLVEEIHVVKRTTVEDVEVPIALRRQVVDIKEEDHSAGQLDEIET